METKYCWLILGCFLVWILQTTGQQLQSNGGQTSGGYRTVGYFTRRNVQGGISRYAIQVQVGTRSNTVNSVNSNVGTNNNVVNSRPTSRSVSQQTIAQRPTYVYTGTPGRYATTRTATTFVAPQSAPVINQPISMISNNPVRQYTNRNTVSLSNGQRTFLVNLPSLISSSVSRAISLRRRNISRNRLFQLLRAAFLSYLSRANIPTMNLTNINSSPQNSIINYPVVIPSNDASMPQNSVATQQIQVQSNTGTIQSGTIRQNTLQINIPSRQNTHQINITNRQNTPQMNIPSRQNTPQIDILSRQNTPRLNIPIVNVPIPVNHTTAMQTSEFDTSGRSTNSTTSTSQTSSSGDPATDTLVRNIVNEVRLTRRFRGNSELNAENDDVIHRGDRIYQPLYKGTMFGERILIARGIRRNDNVQDREEPSRSSDESGTRNEGVQLVGEDIWTRRERITVEEPLPTEDSNTQVNEDSSVSDSEDHVHEISDRTTAIEHHHSSHANDGNTVNVVTSLFGRQDVHDINDLTSATKDHQSSHENDRNPVNVVTRLSDRKVAQEINDQSSERKDPQNVHASNMFDRHEVNVVTRLSDSQGKTREMHDRIPPARDIFNSITVNEVSRLSGVLNAPDGFQQASNDPSMFSSDEWEAFQSEDRSMTESGPSPAGSTEQGHIDSGHSLYTDADMLHGHQPFTHLEAVHQESLSARTASSNQAWDVEDGFIQSSSIELHQHDDLSHMHPSPNVHTASLDAAFEMENIQHSPITDASSTDTAWDVADGFISSGSTETQYDDHSDTGHMSEGLAPNLDEAFELGNIQVLSAALAASDGLDENINADKFAASMDVESWNSSKSIDALWSSQLPSTHRMDAFDQRSVNGFEMSERFSGGVQNSLDKLSASDLTIETFDSGKSMQSSASWSEKSDQFDLFWSNMNDKQSSGLFPDMTAVEELSCPHNAMDFGLCREDSDCMIGYCFSRGSMKGICCK